MKKTLYFLKFSGFVFTGITGTLLHFLFDWTNNNTFVGLFSAVNESIWEHMKLLYVPMLAFAFFESRYASEKYENFWCAKLLGFTIGLMTIPVIYYTYTGALGVSADWFNILIFFISAAISFFVETEIIKSGWECAVHPTAAKIIMILIGFLFLVFTFFPPHLPIFMDPISKTYGINHLV